MVTREKGSLFEQLCFVLRLGFPEEHETFGVIGSAYWIDLTSKSIVGSFANFEVG